jgi:5'-nucleotidase
VLLACTAVAQNTPPCSSKAYIAFVNDVHNRFEETEPSTATPCSPESRAAGRCVGGYGRLSTAIRNLRKRAAQEGAALWLLDAGTHGYTAATLVL